MLQGGKIAFYPKIDVSANIPCLGAQEGGVMVTTGQSLASTALNVANSRSGCIAVDGTILPAPQRLNRKTSQLKRSARY